MWQVPYKYELSGYFNHYSQMIKNWILFTVNIPTTKKKTENKGLGTLIQSWCKEKDGSWPYEEQTIPILGTEASVGLKQVSDRMK